MNNCPVTHTFRTELSAISLAKPPFICSLRSEPPAASCRLAPYLHFHRGRATCPHLRDKIVGAITYGLRKVRVRLASRQWYIVDLPQWRALHSAVKPINIAISNEISAACGCLEPQPHSDIDLRMRGAGIHSPRGSLWPATCLASNRPTNVIGRRTAAKVHKAWLGVHNQVNQPDYRAAIYALCIHLVSSVLGRHIAPGLRCSDCASCLRNGGTLDPR